MKILKNNEIKNNITSIIISFVLLLLVTTGASFAYFTAKITGAEEATTITTGSGTMNIIYNGGSNITVNNIYPREEVWATKNITVTGNNTTAQTMDYNLSLVIVSNTFSYDALKYKLTSTNTGGNGDIIPSITTMQDIGSGDRTILIGNGSFTGPTDGNKVHTYTLEIYFPDTNVNQNYNHGKTLNAYVSIKEGISTSKSYLTDAILNQYNGSANIIDAPAGTFNNINGGIENAMYKMQDDYGTSYYYRGAKAHVKNSLIFAEHQWKIVRINGDGSVRLIYNGICPSNSCAINSQGTVTQMGTSKYNVNSDDNKYIGYMYGGAEGVASTSREQATTNETNSTIKTYLDNWYVTNIQNKGYNSYLSDTIFCNNRYFNSTFDGITNGTGFGKSSTFYFEEEGFTAPSLLCKQKNDRFSVTDSQVGNGALTYPIGLITLNEIIIAGFSNNDTESLTNYLYTNNIFWSLTPLIFMVQEESICDALVFIASSELFIQFIVDNESGVRGVINLKPNTIITGTGSIADPFIVQT